MGDDAIVVMPIKDVKYFAQIDILVEKRFSAILALVFSVHSC